MDGSCERHSESRKGDWGPRYGDSGDGGGPRYGDSEDYGGPRYGDSEDYDS